MNISNAPRQQHAKHFDVLDGLRGLAAISVMVLHYTEHSTMRLLMGGAWIAVDIFFILSGFVLAHSYGAKIQKGMTWQRFAAVRLLRLAPLYFLGAMMGIGSAITLLHDVHLHEFPMAALWHASVLGLIGIPDFNKSAWPFGAGSVRGVIFPLNVPAWSLFFEAFVNVLFFVYAARARKASAWVISAVGYVLFLSWTWRTQEFNPGWGSVNFIGGFPRVIAEFFLGVAVYKSGVQNWKPKPALALILTCLLFGIMLPNDPKLAFIGSLILAPLAIVLLSPINVPTCLRPVFRWLGAVSYPLYVIHYPIYRLAMDIQPISRLSGMWQNLFIALIAIALASALIPIDASIRDILQDALFSPLQRPGLS